MYFKLAKFFTILSIFAIPIVSKSTLFPFIVGKYAWFRGSVGLAFLFFLLGLLLSSDSKAKEDRVIKIIKSPLGVVVGIFTAIFLLAGFFGFDPANSFWSNFERGEGGAQMICVYLFFILLTTLFDTKEGWRSVLGFAIFSGVLSSLYGLFASLGISGFIGSNLAEGASFRFQGSVGNPAYVAVYVLFLIFYSAYLLISGNKNSLKKNFIITGLIVVSVLFFMGTFYFAATRGAFLGLLASLLIFFSYLAFANKRWRKVIVAVIFLGILFFGSLIYFKETSFVKSLPGSRIFDISISATTFGHRTIMWGIAFEGFKDRPIFGWGPENFYQVFDRYFNTKYFNPPEAFGAWFDRAHSLVFDYLVETGMLGLLSFLSIFVVFYFLFFRYVWRSSRFSKLADNKKPESSLVFLFNSQAIMGLFFVLPIAYLIQGLVLFDVLVTYMNLFLFMALANYHFIYFSEESKKLIP